MDTTQGQGGQIPPQVRRAIQPRKTEEMQKMSIDPGEGFRSSFVSSPRSSSSTPHASQNRSLGDLNKLSQAVAGDDRIDPKQSISADTDFLENPVLESKDKKKSSSFLSRIIGTAKKKEPFYLNEVDENESQVSDLRPEGMDAQPFYHNANNIAFNPRYPRPPPYIKVRAKHKRVKEFDHMFLAQELGMKEDEAIVGGDQVPTTKPQSSYAVWALEFSKSGKYLAAGSQDGVVRIFAVLGTTDDRRQFEADDPQADQYARLHAPVFHQRSFRRYRGHKGAITDLNWSKNDFLISSSLDKTVRLWHPSRTECLCTFKHSDHVLSLRFHPQDDRFFLAGCRDAKLRLWSIPDKSIAYWTQLSEPITAVAMTPDGKQSIAGTMTGACYFFETEGLKQIGRLIAKSTHGKNAKGSKINGIDALLAYRRDLHDEGEDHCPEEVRILVSSADSRLRLYNISDRTLESKFKGHKAEELPIRATVSDCGLYFIAGSEDRGAHIWTNGPPEKEAKNGQRPMETFAAHSDKTTVTVMAPLKTRQLLAKSHDPIYELCNPPPVTLVSRTESIMSSKAPTEAGSIQESPPRPAKPTESVIENHHTNSVRNAHRGGHIIVAASSSGLIRVFRQDCGHAKRRSFNDGENSSLFSAGKRPSSIVMARAMSNAGVRRSDSVSTQPPQDRILSWRQGISSVGSFDKSRNGSITFPRRHPSDPSNSNLQAVRAGSPGQSMRSPSMISTRSKHKEGQDLSVDKSPSHSQPGPRSEVHSSATPSRTTTNDSSARTAPSGSPLRNGSLAAGEASEPSIHVTEEEAHNADAIEEDPLMLMDGKTYMFWDPRAYLSFAGFNNRPGPPQHRRSSAVSAVSKLSSEEEDEAERVEKTKGAS